MMKTSLGKKQVGAALFVCLMLLLILSILGISALRMTIGQSLISMNAHAEKLAFQSAESGITQVIAEGENDVARAWLPVDPGGSVFRCIAANAAASTLSSSGDCASTPSDARGVTRTAVKVAKIDSDDVQAAQRSLRAIARLQGLPGVQAESFTFTGTAVVPAVDVEVENVQETLYTHL